MQKTGLLGSYWALLISYVVFTLPVGTWTLKSYFDQLPDSLIESARIDGAGNLKIMFQIVFPITIPGMISIAIYGFVWSWNDLLYSMTLVTDTAKRTLALSLIHISSRSRPPTGRPGRRFSRCASTGSERQ